MFLFSYVTYVLFIAANYIIVLKCEASNDGLRQRVKLNVRPYILLKSISLTRTDDSENPAIRFC